jgi:tRNA (mo5U34)-methyltransferase
VCDDYSPYRDGGGLGRGYPGGQMVMEFYPDAQLAGNATNWWGPSLACLGHMVRAAGFAQVRAWKLTENPQHIGLCRGFAHGVKVHS